MSQTFKEKMGEINQIVDPVIKELLVSNVESENADAVYYQCKVGGKRLRPTLAIICCQLFGGEIEDVVYPAAGLEILHNATLIVDDIIDHSEFRRDEPTCWNKFGKSIAECTSFAYIASAFEGANKTKNSPELIELYGRTLKTIIDGEIKDILFERSGREDEKFVVSNRYPKITIEDYIKMVSQKTASLLSACCETGGICADANADDLKMIGEYGFNLGVAFQIRDDILDIFGDEKQFGKKIGKDIIEKKMGNIVILEAMKLLSSEEKDKVCKILECSDDVADEDVELVISLLSKTDAKKNAEKLGCTYIEKSLEALAKLPQNEHNETLKELAEFIVERKS